MADGTIEEDFEAALTKGRGGAENGAGGSLVQFLFDLEILFYWCIVHK